MNQSSETPSEGAFVRVVFGERDAEDVAFGRHHIFPPEAINELSDGIRMSFECCAMPEVCEELAVVFARALQRAGWKFFRPGSTRPASAQ